MDFSGTLAGRGHRPRQDINLVPFIDILLVLLVIFIVASPVLTHAVRIDLPRVSSTPERKEPDPIQIDVMPDGQILMDGRTIPAGALQQRLERAAKDDPTRAVRLSADARTTYQDLAEVLATAAKAGIARIGFVSSPKKPE